MLKEWAKTRMESEIRGGLQLGTYDDDAMMRRMFSVKSMAGGYSFLVWKDTDEEVVLDATGFIAACVLPPITKNTRSVKI